MAMLPINVGSAANDGTGDPLRTALGKANTNFAELAATDALKAPLASPALTGTPTAPTAALGTNTAQIATMAALKAALDALVANAPGALDTLKEIADQLALDENAVSALTTVVGTKAPLASPAFTGTPTAPTAAAGTSTTQVASTAFVAALGALKAAASHTHATADVTGLDAALTARLTEAAVRALRGQYSTEPTGRAIVDADHGKDLTYTGSAAATFTLPSGLAVGTLVTLTQDGTGKASFAAGSGATVANLRASGQLSTAAQGASIVAELRATNTWRVSGDAGA